MNSQAGSLPLIILVLADSQAFLHRLAAGWEQGGRITLSRILEMQKSFFFQTSSFGQHSSVHPRLCNFVPGHF